MPPLHFALIGYGRVAPTHADAIRHLGPDARLVAVCNSNPAARTRAESATGARIFARMEEMLQLPEIDVVSICTPSGLHAEHGISTAGPS
ncbi:MAG: Gfo/Idh/MocA family protein [Kiritimatiellia bacterium]